MGRDWVTIVIGVVDYVVVLVLVVVVGFLERRTMALLHMRDGPVANGILGVLQPLCDGIKLLVQLCVCSVGLPRVGGVGVVCCGLVVAFLGFWWCGVAYCSFFFFNGFSVMLLVLVLTGHAVIEVAIGVMCVSRYSFLATCRVVVIMLSADIGWLLVLCFFFVCSSSALSSVVISCGVSSIVLCGLVVVVCGLESGVQPFDLVECEPEVVSGYFVDHGGVLFMLIYLGDGVIFVCVLCFFWLIVTTFGGLMSAASLLASLGILGLVLLLRFLVVRYRIDSMVGVFFRWLLGIGNACLGYFFFFFFF
nr:NADH dehydrogenase subunit 1 [Namystynia karyoxenos]